MNLLMELFFKIRSTREMTLDINVIHLELQFKYRMSRFKIPGNHIKLTSKEVLIWKNV